VKAFSDPGDSIFDPFMGSGTTMAAAHVLGRTGYGCEISPAYCDVILRRMAELDGRGAGAGRIPGSRIREVAQNRGVTEDQVENPKLKDARRIQHDGVRPNYGSKRKAP
jgi:hypothetical protein